MRAPHAWAFAVEAAVPWVREVIESGLTLHEWAATRADRRVLAGRGTVYSVPAPVPGPDARGRWVVRHYYRGGAIAHVLDDRYLAVGRPRPLNEARASIEARSREIATPAVVAGAIYPAGVFYRADLVTEEIPQASDLAAILFGVHADGSVPATERLDPTDSLAAAARLVRAMEQKGISHPDLNAKNIVLRSEADGPHAHLVDLDRCYARLVGVPGPAFPMRQRLERSLRKFGLRTGSPLSESQWAALRAGWEKGL